MGKKINWTKEQETWIKENGIKYNDQIMTKKFNEEFQVSINVKTLTHFRWRLGILKPKFISFEKDGKVRVRRSTRHITTQEEKEWILNNKNKIINRNQFLNDFNKHFNLDLNSRQFTNIYLKVCNNLFRNSFFTKEEDEWLLENIKYQPPYKLVEEFNKRFDQKRTGRQLKEHLNGYLKTSYLKINNKNSVNSEAIGTIKKWGNNYKIKINDKDWEICSRYFYKQYYGKLSEDCIVLHLDGNIENWNKDNLIEMSRKEAGKLTGLSVGNGINYYKNGILTKAIVEVIKTENLLKEIEND